MEFRPDASSQSTIDRHVSTAPCANPDLLRALGKGLPSCIDLDAAGIPGLDRLPRSLRVLAEDPLSYLADGAKAPSAVAAMLALVKLILYA